MPTNSHNTPLPNTNGKDHHTQCINHLEKYREALEGIFESEMRELILRSQEKPTTLLESIKQEVLDQIRVDARVFDERDFVFTLSQNHFHDFQESDNWEKKFPRVREFLNLIPRENREVIRKRITEEVFLPWYLETQKLSVYPHTPIFLEKKNRTQTIIRSLLTAGGIGYKVPDHLFLTEGIHNVDSSASQTLIKLTNIRKLTLNDSLFFETNDEIYFQICPTFRSIGVLAINLSILFQASSDKQDYFYANTPNVFSLRLFSYDKHLDEACFQELVTHYHKVSQLDLSELHPSMSEKTFFSHLHRFKNLKSLKIGIDQLEYIPHTAHNILPQLQALSITDAHLSQTQYQEILSCISNARNLLYLDFSSRLGSISPEEIKTYFSGYSKLRHLKISPNMNMSMSRESLESLFELFPHLHSLSLGMEEINVLSRQKLNEIFARFDRLHSFEVTGAFNYGRISDQALVDKTLGPLSYAPCIKHLTIDHSILGFLDFLAPYKKFIGSLKTFRVSSAQKEYIESKYGKFGNIITKDY